MGLFSRMFGKSKPINVVAPVDAATGKMVVTENVRIKWRPSQTVPPALRDEIVAVCRDDPSVKSASILDVLEQPTGELKIFVTISFDDPAVDLHRVAPKLQQVFGRYPEFKNRFFIGADIVPEVPAEAAAYRRAR